MAELTHRISRPCGSTDSRIAEGDTAEVSPVSPSFLLPLPLFVLLSILPLILYVPCHTLPGALTPFSHLRSIKALISMEKEVDRRGLWQL